MLIVSGIESEYLPVVILETEKTRLLLPRKAGIFQQKIVVPLASRVHVVIGVERPGGDLVLFAGLDRPVREEMLFVFTFPTRVVDIAEMNNMQVAVLGPILPQFFPHAGADFLRPRQPAAPITYQNHPRLVPDLEGRGRLVIEPAPAPKRANAHR